MSANDNSRSGRETNQHLAILLMLRDSLAYLDTMPDVDMGGDHAPSFATLGSRRVFINRFTESVRDMVEVSRSPYQDDILFAASCAAGLVGYLLATQNEFVDANIIATRSQLLVNAVSVGFHQGLEAVMASGGRRRDGSLHGGH